MKSCPILALLLILQLAPAGMAREIAQASLAEQAAADGLWEVAALHYRKLLDAPDLTADETAVLTIRLAEAYVRCERPQAALELLQKNAALDPSDALFWQAQALAGQGRYEEASEVLKSLLGRSDVSYRYEAAATRANLLLSLGQSDEALETLASLEGELSLRARLRRVELLLDLERFAEARAAMPEVVPGEDDGEMFAALLEARLLLAEARFAEAEDTFSVLLSQPGGQTLSHYHAAAVGYADALLAQGRSGAALDALFDFITYHPDSPSLEALFQRVSLALPEELSRNDAIFARLDRWIPVMTAPPLWLALDTPSAAAAWPEPIASGDLAAFAMFTKAACLRKTGDPQDKHAARVLLTRLRLQYPGHPLAIRALVESGRWALEDGNAEEAFAMLGAVRATAKSPALQGEAAFEEARASYLAGNPSRAATLFDEAASHLEKGESEIARLNAAIARLQTGNPDDLVLVQADNAIPRELRPELELEQALAQADTAGRIDALRQFLARHPDHPLASQARLAWLELALASTPPDLAAAEQQWQRLSAEAADGASPIEPQSLALARLRFAAAAQTSDLAEAAAVLIEAYPDTPAAFEAAFTLGRHEYQSGNYNDARLILEKLAASDPSQAQICWLLSARSAALIATRQSRDEAIGLFDKAISTDGPLVSIALLEKARLLIDLHRYPEAIAMLRERLASMPGEDPLRLPVGILLGEAVTHQASADPNALAEALTIYDQLLESAKAEPALFHRLQYLRGWILEKLSSEEAPSLTRETEALDAYYSVLQTTRQPAEWLYFENCGFRALAILEKSQRWSAAIAIAEKIASFQGPRAEEAMERARELRLKHMIWED